MKVKKIELHTIFKGIAEGKKEAFDLLYDKYSNLVYGAAFSILKNKENSEDILQKVFLKIWKLDKHKLPTCSEASWLYSLAKNESLNYLRSKKEEVDIDELYYIAKEDTQLNEIMDIDSYNRIISRLNNDEQEIVSLKILSSLSFKQISQVLNIPMGTAQWKYYKSINTLKLLMTNISLFIISIGLFSVERKIENNKKSTTSEIVKDNKIPLNSNDETKDFANESQSTKLETRKRRKWS